MAPRCGPGAASGRERPGPQLERVAHIVEADAVAQLRVEQGHHMAPRAEGARLLVHLGLAGDLGNQMRGNEIANLAQNGELATRWLNCFVIHACRVAGSTQQADAFFGFFLIWVKFILNIFIAAGVFHYRTLLKRHLKKYKQLIKI